MAEGATDEISRLERHVYPVVEIDRQIFGCR